MIFVLEFSGVMYHIYIFMYVEPSQHAWKESHMVWVNDLSNALFYLFCFLKIYFYWEIRYTVTRREREEDLPSDDSLLK